MEEQNKSTHTLRYKGFLKGHGGWVTSLAVGEEEVNGERVEFLISGSRDKSLIRWDLALSDDENEQGRPRKMYTGHSHFVSQVVMTKDSRYAFSSSWDGTCRLWDIQNGQTISKLIGHSKDVLSVALSADDRQVMTGSMDKNIKIWNTRSVCKHTVDKNQHTDAVSAVRFYQNAKTSFCVTASWDKTIKVWHNLYMNLLHTFTGHKAQINSLDTTDQSGFLASGSRDGQVILWDLVRGKVYSSIDVDTPVNVVCFSQRLYWLVIGTEEGIKVIDAPKNKVIQEIKETSLKRNEEGSTKTLACTSLAWSTNGTHLYAGFSDNFIRVYSVEDIVAAAEE